RHSASTSPCRSRRWSAWYSAASSTATWPSVRSWTSVAIPYPCLGPDARAPSTSRSRVPWTSGSGGGLVTLPLRRCGEADGWQQPVAEVVSRAARHGECATETRRHRESLVFSLDLVRFRQARRLLRRRAVRGRSGFLACI